jgi:chromosome partitioning protein
MKTIAVVNQKGGVGKTTTALALGAGFALRGYRTLFVDLDAQGNLTSTLGADGSGLTGRNSFDVLTGAATAKTAAQRTEQGDIIAGSPALAGADAAISGAGREHRLRKALEPLRGEYDCVVIDTPPALGVLAINALTACGGVLIPAHADIYSLQGISQLHGTIQAVRKHCNPSLRIAGIVLTRHNGRTVIGRDIAEAAALAAARMGTRLCEARIREATAVKEAQARRRSIFSYAPRSGVAADYEALVEEIIREENGHAE